MYVYVCVLRSPRRRRYIYCLTDGVYVYLDAIPSILNREAARSFEASLSTYNYTRSQEAKVYGRNNAGRKCLKSGIKIIT
jgi:hypothetical protein